MNEHLTQRIIDALRDALDCMAAKVNSPMVREDCYNVIAKIKESISEQPLQPADVVLAALRPMELSPWTAEHCKSYPRKASEIINAALGFKTLIAQPVQLATKNSIEIDFKQTTELLQMFGGEPTSITLMLGDGHSGKGLYAHYTEVPGEGAEYLGETNDEANPIAQQVQSSGTDGWKLVPVNPTPAMKAAGSTGIGYDFAHNCYASMLAASPSIPQPIPPATPMPKFPYHPEPHTMVWTALEMESIHEYGKNCFDAGNSQSVLPATITEREIEVCFPFLVGWNHSEADKVRYRRVLETYAAIAQQVQPADGKKEVDISGLQKQVSAYKTLTESLGVRIATLQAGRAEWREAVNTLSSEREANAMLTDEIAALLAAIAQPVPVAFWEPIKLSDAPPGIEEIYPEERGYQFLAPRGDGSAKGDQGWIITLPALPTASDFDTALREYIAPPVPPNMADFSALEKAARDAATSLGTIAQLAGRETFGTPPVETYMQSFMEVRQYANSRAIAAKEEIDVALKAIAQPVSPDTVSAVNLIEMVDAAMIEMSNIQPPLRRNECQRLISAAINAKETS